MTTCELRKKTRLVSENKESVSTNLLGNRAVPRAVISDEFIVDVTLRDAYVGILKNKKDIATAIKSITEILPGFHYLKRYSNGKLLLAFANTSTGKSNDDISPAFSSRDDLKTFLKEKNFNAELLEENFPIVSVPGRTPRTKSQAKQAANTWPVNFHPDMSIELILSGKFFNSEQLDIIDACMKLCIEASRLEAYKNDYCNGSVVILDPDDNGTSQIIAIASCKINEHPMWHAAMLAIDLVAQFRGGGAWKLNTTPKDGVLTSIESHKRRFPSTRPNCFPPSLKNLEIPKFHCSATRNMKIKHDDNSDTESNTPYLCTNYWVFLMEEPCPICAMALLHSRVSMVFYGIPNKSHGILGSKALLHTLPGLNHRYKVWSDVLRRDYQRTAIEMSQSGQ